MQQAYDFMVLCIVFYTAAVVIIGSVAFYKVAMLRRSLQEADRRAFELQAMNESLSAQNARLRQDCNNLVGLLDVRNVLIAFAEARHPDLREMFKQKNCHAPDRVIAEIWAGMYRPPAAQAATPQAGGSSPPRLRYVDVD